MIISHRQNFIFVKTRKTAGTSVQEAVATICGQEDIVTPTCIAEGSYHPRHFAVCRRRSCICGRTRTGIAPRALYRE